MTAAAQGSPDRPTLLLHLGWDAATAVAVQRHFADHSGALRDAGVLYPATGRITSSPHCHDRLAKAFAPAARAATPCRQELLDALLDEVAAIGVRTVLISSDEFASFREDSIREFGVAFRDFAIRPVIVLRNFTDWLSQRYGTRVMAEPCVSLPNAATFEGRLLVRLAAWAATAADDHLHVVDADATGTGAGTALIGALDMAAALPGLPPDAAAPLDLVAPALVAIVRDLRARGVTEPDLQALAAQLSVVNFAERQTNVAAADAALLDERYATFHARLRDAPFVRWHGRASSPCPAERVHIGNTAGAVFAIGRALR